MRDSRFTDYDVSCETTMNTEYIAPPTASTAMDVAEELPPEEIIEDILAINVVATARVTRMIVPHMVQKCAGS